MVKRRHRHFAIFGAYGGANTGDEMILRAVVKLARVAGCKGGIAVVGARIPGPQAMRTDYEERGLTLVTWRNPFKAAKAVAGRDLFIGGGQLIDGLAGIRYPLIQAGLAAIVRLTGGRITIGGVSAMRLTNAAVRRTYGWLFHLAHRIATRDAASMDDILAITPSVAEKSEILADVVFALAEEICGGPPVWERNVIAFSVHHSPLLAFTDFDASLRFLRRLHAMAGSGREIVILAHDVRSDFDLGYAKRLLKQLNAEGVSVRSFATTNECMDFYRQLRTIVSARMHPIIIGACAESFCVPLAGSRKVADISARLGLKQWRLDDLTALPGKEFLKAVGLNGGGPEVDQKAREELTAQARRALTESTC